MGFTYTPGTPVFYVRLLVPDTQAPGIFSDDEINGFLAINSMVWQSSQYFSYAAGSVQLPSTPSNFLRAAALALNTLASNQARVLAVSQLLDVKLQNVGSVCKALQDSAQRYLDMDDNSGAFAIAEAVTTVWSFRDRWISMLQRQTGGGATA
jgi:hypothetical protein